MAAETDRQIIQKVIISWRSGSALSTRSGSNDNQFRYFTLLAVSVPSIFILYLPGPVTFWAKDIVTVPIEPHPTQKLKRVADEPMAVSIIRDHQIFCKFYFRFRID